MIKHLRVKKPQNSINRLQNINSNITELVFCMCLRREYLQIRVVHKKGNLISTLNFSNSGIKSGLLIRTKFRESGQLMLTF